MHEFWVLLYKTIVCYQRTDQRAHRCVQLGARYTEGSGPWLGRLDAHQGGACREQLQEVPWSSKSVLLAVSMPQEARGGERSRGRLLIFLELGPEHGLREGNHGIKLWEEGIPQSQ